MPLTQPQIDKLQTWLGSKARGNACPVCGQSNWTVGDIVSAPVFSGSGISIGGKTIPMVQVVCTNCAYIQLFAVAPIGLLK